ncbi:MAG: carbohydrate porin [Pseudomonadota bacterium]
MLVGAGTAWASDAEGEYHGYFRAGAGRNSGHGPQACFGLEGVAKYRLGNECDTYGEWGYTKEIAKAANGASFVGTFMAYAYTPSSDISNSDLRSNQAFVEARNIDFLHGGTAWAGKRFYNRPDIHVLDLKYLYGDGVGAGIAGLPVGPGKFSYAVFRADVDKDIAATRQNFSYDGVPVNLNGTLKLDLTLIRKDSSVPGAHNGWSVSAVHRQEQVLGGDNTFGLQYGVGAGSKIGGTGDIMLGSDFKRTRIFEQMIWQLTPEFSGSLVGLLQRDKSDAGSQTWTTFGARPVYALHDNFKLQLDFGHDRIKPALGGAPQKLSKLTFAPTITAGKAYWTRPELRAFLTYAKWNKAAQQAATAGTTLSSTGVFGGNTNGTSIGAQVEAWF